MVPRFGGGSYFPSRSLKLYNRPSLGFTREAYTDVFKVFDVVTLDSLIGYPLSDNFLVYARLGAGYSQLSEEERFYIF